MRKYDKLVRDKIPDRIKAKGEPFSMHIADDREYRQKLVGKLQEEVDEFGENESLDELADLLEVIYAICLFKNWDQTELENLRRKKAAERGGFSKRIILEES